jgi:hypothetical protein
LSPTPSLPPHLNYILLLNIAFVSKLFTNFSSLCH